MELYLLQTFLTVANEKSFSRAGEKLLRTQPAVSLAIQRLENELGEKLIDRSGKELLLTDSAALWSSTRAASTTCASTSRTRWRNCAITPPARLIIGANESTTLYLLHHVERYRHTYPKIKVQVRRSLSSKVPAQLIDGDLELGLISYNPDDDRLVSQVIYRDHLAFVVSPEHRFAERKSVSITELGMETFIAHNVISPYREVVVKEFQRRKVQLNMDVEMPTVESIRRLVQRNEGVAFLPRMCVEQELGQGLLHEVAVEEIDVDRNIRLVYPAKRALSHAARAFLELVRSNPLG